jgi:glutamate-ammonia-ligase adenylyltransferase
MAGSVLSREDASLLIETADLEQALTQILRIAVDGTLEPEQASAGLKTLLARAAGVPDFVRLERELHARQKAVHALFGRLLEG